MTKKDRRVRVLAQAMVGLNLSWEGIVIVYLKGISDPYVREVSFMVLEKLVVVGIRDRLVVFLTHRLLQLPILNFCALYLVLESRLMQKDTVQLYPPFLSSYPDFSLK